MARKIAQDVIDQIAEEYSSGQKRRLYAALRRRARKLGKAAERRLDASLVEDGSPGLPPTDNFGKAIQEPADVLLGKAIKAAVDVEEAIARIQERTIKTIAPAQALLEAIMGQRSGNITIEFAPESEPEPKKDSDV